MSVAKLKELLSGDVTKRINSTNKDAFIKQVYEELSQYQHESANEHNTQTVNTKFNGSVELERILQILEDHQQQRIDDAQLTSILTEINNRYLNTNGTV